MRALIRQYRGLPRPIYVLFISKIVDATGCFIWPLVTLILTRKIGLSSAQAGIVVSASMAVNAVAPMVGGKIADAIGRKPAIAVFTGCAIVSYLICGLLPPSPLMLVFIVLGIACLGAASPAHDALVADIVPTERRQIAYSLLYLGWNVGFAAGPAIGGFLLENHLSIMFIGDAATAFIALLMVMFMVPEPARSEKQETARPAAETGKEGSILSVLLQRPVLLFTGLVIIGYSISYSQWGFLLPIQLTGMFGDEGSRIFGLVASVNGITVLVANPVFTFIFKRTPLRYVIFLSGFFYTFGFGLMGLASSLPVFFLLTVVFTLGEVAGAISITPFIMERTPASHRGRMGGVTELMKALGNIAGPAAVGAALGIASVRTAWIGIGLVALAAGAVALALGRMEGRGRGGASPGCR